MKKTILSISACALISTSLVADENLANIQAQIDELKKNYETRIDNLEKQLQTALKKQSFEPKESLAQNSGTSFKESSIGSSFSQKSFIPDMSLIADFSYAARSINQDELQHLEIPGLAHGVYSTHSHGGHTHAGINANNGFNFNYAEVGMFSSVDDWLDLSAIFHLGENSFEVEEAYFNTTSLPYNFKIKGGKFYSGFGRLNSQHQHTWDFSDAPLVYSSFLGDHNLLEIGAQTQLLLPTSFYWMVGAEALDGSNESSFGNKAISPVGNEEDIFAKTAPQPSLYVAYTKTSFDVGDTSILTGVSYAKGNSRIDHLEDESPHAFSGDTSLLNVELTTKTAFDSYSYLQWQSEWMKRDMKGDKFTYPANSLTTFNSTNLSKQQEGFYTQLVYAINQNYKIGARYNSIYKNYVADSGQDSNQPDNLDSYSFKFDYRHSEYALFRLQYSHENDLYNEEGVKKPLDSLIFEVNLAIGSHPAHSF